MGAEMVKEAASKTADEAGDGTTTATILAEAILTEACKNIAAGADAMALKRGVQKAVDAITVELKNISRPVRGREDIAFVGSIAANNDPEIGKQIADAMEKVGKDGVITVEEGKALETTVELVEGMQFDRGYLSPHFVTNRRGDGVRPGGVLRARCTRRRSATCRTSCRCWSRWPARGKPLLVIAEDVESEALATLVVNRLRGALTCCAVKAPGFGDRRKAMMQDIAVLVGAQMISKDLGINMESVGLAELGRAKKVIIDKDNTTIVAGRRRHRRHPGPHQPDQEGD